MEPYREVGATEPIEIICGYRAPATNSMLRRRSKGVARFSQHTLGKAIDLHIPGVPLAKQREAAMRLQRGGVGYYPSSTFIHVDVGRIRHWPRMTYAQLSKVFPDGRTVHIPSNGKPLPNYKLALADVARGGRSPSQMSLDAARTAGVDVTAPKKRPALLAKLFGAPDIEEEEDNSRKNSASASKPSAPAKVAVIPAPRANPRRSIEIAATKAAAAEKPIQTASADGFIPRSSGQEPTARTTPWPLREAKNDRVPLEIALAYAADIRDLPTSSVDQTAATTGPAEPGAQDPAPAERDADKTPLPLVKKIAARLAGGIASKLTPRTTVRPSVAVTAGMRFDDPWLRAAMFAPSLYTSFTTSLSGEPDYASLQHLMDKPDATVKMTFSDNPNPGLTSDRFSGGAVVFVSTVTFQHTAALE
ncbi:MAG: DUF882 domain-containing protein [Xanthobacteraceae bacterium]